MLRVTSARALFALVLLSPLPAVCQTEDFTLSEFTEVTATRVAEDSDTVPAAITIVSGDELRARGANDLASALSQVAGVSIAPGGDGGPAASVPELWGLREFDAFLLVVDGIPTGGAFLPELASLDLAGVDRIEILRGSAPVMYGATSFVGVIHVIHHEAGAAKTDVSLFGGSYGSFGVSASAPLSPPDSAFRQSIIASYEKQGQKDDEESYKRGHVLWRGLANLGEGKFRTDLDVTILRQSPGSPTPRAGRVLTDLVPIDANNNPRDAKLDENRFRLVLGYDQGGFSTALSYTQSKHDNIRGFLGALEEVDPNADGYTQEQELKELYFDAHYAFSSGKMLRGVIGLDHTFGKGEQESENFGYFVGLDGHDAQSSKEVEIEERTELEDERNFTGLYANAEITPMDGLRFDVGVRANQTKEKIEGRAEEGEEEDPGAEEEGASDSMSKTKVTGVLGASFRLMGAEKNEIWAFLDWRSAYKPAVVDFGPEAEGEILDPETARSWEGGVKGRFLDAGIFWQVSAFRMDMENMVIPTQVDGHPALENAGEEIFKGVEAEVEYRMSSFVTQLSYAWHDATFGDYLRDFDGTLMQLRGNRQEMSAKHLASASLGWLPKEGFFANVSLNYVGDRYLNKRNTALVDSYTTWAAGCGWRQGPWELRVDGTNLSDERDPISESELGDAQYYRMPARKILGTVAYRF